MHKWLILAALTAYVLLGVRATPFHGDESTLIYMGRDTAYLLHGQLERLLYSETTPSPTEQHLRLLNGTLGKLGYGLLNVLGSRTLDDWNEQWEWAAGWDYNLQTNRLPDPAILLAARWLSALALIVGLAAFVACVRLLLRRAAWIALPALALLTLHPVVLLNGRRAVMESWMLAGVALSLWAGLRLARRFSLTNVLLLGLFSGLAVAGKHTAAMAIVGIFGGLVTVHLRRFPALVGAGLLALLVFYALNPSWWGDPLARLGTVLALRTELLTGQVSAFGGYVDTLDRWIGFVRQSFWPTPQYYEVSGWGAFIGGQIQAYEAAPWAGLRAPGLDLVVSGWAVIGSVGLLRRWREPTVRVVLAWAGVTLVFVLLLTPLEWQRYYMPMYPVVVLCMAHGADMLWPHSEPV
ncbi:MAG: glycosyltransferase family 39 protein [Anaerolineae bacterium]|nr:glycosyltransferase family 39 protein [Anaerolineae bacterium]MDW8171138.1 glycosyltransferase family 39 protein [Anaerolineae bacterium]